MGRVRAAAESILPSLRTVRDRETRILNLIQVRRRLQVQFLIRPLARRCKGKTATRNAP